MRIVYKRIALLDLQRTRDHITDTLKNKSAAQKLETSVLHAISLLSDRPMMGTALNSRYGVDSNIRFLVVSKQLVFYKIFDDNLISIIRILDGRQDYMSILF